MTEARRTAWFAGAAALLLVLAVATAPRKNLPGAFSDRGQIFFPEFTDPNSAVSLEVIDFDPEAGAAVPFKVLNSGGRWTIPSHHDYPADGKDRLAQTAASVIELRKEDFRTDNVADHAACGVVDPLDDTAPGLEGRGRRVTVKGAQEKVLADFIVGAQVEGREGFRFVRLPGQKRVYVTRLGDEVSSKFADWIEADLLKVTREDFTRLVLRDYSIDELTGSIKEHDTVTITKDGQAWKIGGRDTDQARMNDLLGALDELVITGVRPKPAGLTQSLSKSGSGVMITIEDMYSLRDKGYYFARDGRLLSNEGELQALTSDGVLYTLRFGEVVYGKGEAVSAGVDSINAGAQGPGENRYLFITTEVDGSGGGDIARGRTLSSELNARFAGWYYVIPSSSFEKLHFTRKDLLARGPA